MKKFNFFKFVSVTMAVLACTLNVSCVDDNDDTEAPYLEVSPSTLSFDTNGVPVAESQAFFQISTNRHWTATVQSEKSWITLSATEGEGSADIQVSIPEGINDQATVTIAISNKVGALMSQTVTIVSGSVLPATTIYRETFGTAAPSSSPYPFVDAYTGWDKSGEGSSTTEYTGVAASVRQSGKLSAGYEGASGGAKLFFGSGANFVINKITLQEAQTNLKLTFGGSYSKNTNGVYDNVFKPELFHVYLSADGTTWSNALTYETKQADDYWVLATSHFTLKNPTTTLYIKYVADEASVFSMDDPTLVTGPGGQEVVFDNTPQPGEAKVITIPEMIQAMTAAQTVLDATADRFFEAIVQNDTVGGNYSFNNLILTTVGATTAGNGITLYGSQVEPTAIKVNKGDKVKVTLYKGLAKLVNYNGMYEVTGAKEDTWAKVEKIGTATVTPIVITADKLVDYQGMPVTIQNATTATAGVWATNTDLSSHNFTVQTTPFVVFCKKGAGVFVDAPFNAATGAISGLAAVNRNIGQLVPRDLNDVKAFNSSAPLIVSVNPESVSLPAAGGTQEISVTCVNQGGNAISASGLSGILSATVSGTTVTVTAAANTTATAVQQTLTISLAGGNSVTVPVTVKAAGESDTKGTYTSMTPFLFGSSTDKLNAYSQDLSINGTVVEGLKLGTSSKSGFFTSGAIGVTGSKKMSFYAGAWKGESMTVYIRVNGGGSVSGSDNVAVAANAGFTGTGVFTVTFADTDYFTLNLTGLTATSTITIATDAGFTGTGGKARGVLCGIQLY
ncbi:DUF5689 domain-containing protein [Bacteroides sp.]|uniref:DUF5689 domain-containing protein n=1 Tax=Bacteroides sp. TaxID=29523 RepID=UPI002FC76E31